MFAAPLLALALLCAEQRFVTETRDGVSLTTDLSRQHRDSVFEVAAVTARLANDRLGQTGLTRKSDQNLRMRVFAHESDFEDWRRRTRDLNTKVSPLSFYDETDREVIAAWQAGSATARAQLRRQVARFVLLQYAKNPSNWFEEGFAGYYEGFESDAFGDAIDRVDTEMLRQVRDALAHERFCPLYDLLDLQDVEFYGLAGAKQSPWPRSVLYAQSWSLVFWMFESKDDAAAQLLEFEVQRLDTGRWDQARAKTLVQEVEPQWRAFLDRDDLMTFGTLVRDAWTALGKNEIEDARWYATKALALDETCRSALRVLAKATFAQDDFDVAAHAYSELLRDRPTDFDAALGLALADRAQLALEPQDASLLTSVIDAGTRASELAPQGQGHVGYALAAEAAESVGAVEDALRLVRSALKAKSLDATTVAQLRDRERVLIRKSIGKG